MPSIQIFKPGKHTAANGAAVEFSQADLEAAAAAYDPALHEAPLVVGHPKDNGPAYGWVKSLQFADGILNAEPEQVDPAFADLVNTGRFKKVSASFYLPDSPNNPKPGQYYLRHVGFLGAQPPAVKGLKSVQFDDGEQGVVEFIDWGLRDAGSLFGQLREWLIGKFGLDEANKAIPSWQVDSVKEAARDDDKPAGSALSYTDPNPQQETHLGKTAEQLAADLAAANARIAEFSERERSQKHSQIVTAIDALVADGRVLPKDRDGAIAFAAQLDEAGTVEFGEGDLKQAVKPGDWFMGFLKALPKAVDFSERAGAGNEPDLALTDRQVAERAQTLVDKRREAGRSISFTEAVDLVTAGKDKE